MTMLRIAVIVAVVLQVALARKFDVCSFARELRKHGIPNNHELNEWVCIAEHESGLNTRAVNHYNSDGSRDYGIFQINDRYWCEHGRSGKGCNVSCGDLINDNLAADIRCARHIKQVQGLSAWVAWNNKCAGRHIKDVSLAKKFTACELAKELRRLGASNNQELNELVCLAQKEGSFDTRTVKLVKNPQRYYDSHSYGIFQINDHVWCEHRKPGNICNVKCEDMLNDDISDDYKCAKYIKDSQGRSWHHLHENCSGKNAADVTKC
ncbi:hypothetical protein L9F63_001282 [Diploptera punctata]|uniref:lysozyme n=1 Tax=Diploptera punctata TaxID=6984 RepID=A0AAD8EJ78_DIPPU|nr:hypothetical protein L9F63_001282 [Diploptera punctata]